MPSYGLDTRRDYASSSDPYHSKAQNRGPASPTTPAVTGIEYPSPVDAPSEGPSVKPRGQMSRPFYSQNNIASSTLGDPTSLDRIWGSIREEKERKLAKERPKVQSLEERDQSSHIQIPVQSQASVPKSLTTRKSISNIRESTDGRSIVTTFDMPPDVSKQDVHIIFQRTRLVITWESVEVSEWMEDGVIMRERIEKHFNRTLPLPEGTKFSEIQAVMIDGDKKLRVRYPNMRCCRIDGRSRSGDS